MRIGPGRLEHDLRIGGGQSCLGRVTSCYGRLDTRSPNAAELESLLECGNVLGIRRARRRHLLAPVRKGWVQVRPRLTLPACSGGNGFTCSTNIRADPTCLLDRLVERERGRLLCIGAARERDDQCQTDRGRRAGAQARC
jgi:hypothetical protein